MERASVREAPHRKVRISSNPAKQVANTKSISLAWSACLSTIEQSGQTHKRSPTLLVQDNAQEGTVDLNFALLRILNIFDPNSGQ